MFKSKQYIQFIKAQGCCISGSRHLVEAHHEMIFTSNTGKRYDDFNCVPLSHVYHEKRHNIGYDSFWENRDPRKIAEGLLTEYKKKMSPDWFSSLEEFDREWEVVESHLARLQEEVST